MKTLLIIPTLFMAGCATWIPPITAKVCYTTKYGTVCAKADKDALAVDFAIRGLSKD